MKNKPLVSLIIPVYNGAEFLRECLDSAVNQTLKNIEIICVNDASTDNSLEIMNEYAKKDSRVRIVNKKENGGTLMARKDGVAVANGEFTMFLDGDDCLAPNACETAYNLIVKNDVDIIWYSFAVNEYDSNGNVVNMCVRNQPCEEFLQIREQLQSRYFLKEISTVNLCDKIFKTELLKLAFSKIENFYCRFGEDRYAMYYILYHAQNMKIVITEPLYIYCYGRGGGSSYRGMSINEFENYCYQRSVLEGRIRKFLEREGTLEEQEKYLSGWRQLMTLKVVFSVFVRRVKKEDFDQAVKILYSYWNEKDDTEEITLNLLTQLRDHVDWNKNLAASQIQIEDKDARIKELQDWNAEQLKAQEWFLSQIANKNARIAELQKNRRLCNKAAKKISNILKKCFRNKL